MKNILDRNEASVEIGFFDQLSNFFVFMGLAAFMTSLFLPAFFTSDGELMGGWVLILGWMGIVVFQFSWISNPLIILALLISETQPRLSLILSVLALTIALNTLMFKEIPTGFFSGIEQEKIFIKEIGLGFYIWYLSLILFLVALINKYIKQRGNH